jgi:hypothetical protein
VHLTYVEWEKAAHNTKVFSYTKHDVESNNNISDMGGIQKITIGSIAV